MKLQDKHLSPEENLRLIQDHMSRTKQGLRNKSFDILFWGILIALASGLEYVLLVASNFEKPWLPWPVLMIGGTIITVIYHLKRNGSQPVTTFTDHFLMWLSIGTGAVYFVLAFLCVRQQISPLPYILANTFILLFVTGAVLRYKSLVLGGIVFLIGSIISIFLRYEQQLLLTTCVVVVGYILPGFLLRKEKY
jgi:hypothetical protein